MRGRGRILLALVFLPVLAVLLGVALLFATVGHYNAQTSHAALPPKPTPTVERGTHVDSKKLKEKERDFVLAVEVAYGENMTVAQEKNVLTMGHTYCVAVGAGFDQANVIRLYGKHDERPEAEGVNLVSLSMTVLCPPR